MTTAIATTGPPAELGLREVSERLALSGLYADSKDPKQALAKILLGKAIGVDPASAMAGIIITRGKMSMSANLMAMLIKRSPKYRYTIVKHTNEECAIRVVERVEATTKDGKPTVAYEPCGPDVSFTMTDAKAAGLAHSDTYKKFPKNMLFARAISNAARFYCADVFGGSPVYLPDELPGGARVDPETLEVVAVADAEAVADAGEAAAGVPAGHDAAAVEALLALTGVDRAKFFGYYEAADVGGMNVANLRHAANELRKRVRAQ